MERVASLRNVWNCNVKAYVIEGTVVSIDKD